eukprot:sb/3473189/
MSQPIVGGREQGEELRLLFLVNQGWLVQSDIALKPGKQTWGNHHSMLHSVYTVFTQSLHPERPRRSGCKVGFFEVVTPLGGVRVFICASESCFGSHAFVSWPIWSIQSFTDSQNYPVISGFLPKSESKWGLSRANTMPRDKRGVTTSKNRLYRDP